MVALLASPFRGIAADGDLDSAFGPNGNGLVVTDAGSGFDQGFAMALQGDGRIVVAGTTYTPTGFDFAVARYTADGLLDPSFGIGGIVVTDFGFSDEQAYAVAVQNDGKIVVAGSSYHFATGSDFALARYTAEGALDATFGAGGIVRTDFALGDDEVDAIAVLNDGRIIVAGFAESDATSWDFAVARYTASGDLDPTFNGNGMVTTDFASNTDFAYALAIQSDGRLVVAGRAFDSGNGYRFALVRYTADGLPDISFGTSGRVITDIGGVDTSGFHISGVQALVIQSDGRIVAAGYAAEENLAGLSFALARYSTDGSLDVSFGSAGRVLTDFATGSPNDDIATAVALQNDGRIVAAGFAFDGSTGNNFALARYDANGSLDASFSGDGKVASDFSSGDDYGYATIIQGSGKIVVAGTSADPFGAADFALARYSGVSALADLGITKTAAPDPVSAAETLSFTITVSNHGPADASDIVVADILPPSLAFVSADAAGGGQVSASGNNVAVSIATLAQGSSVIITLITKVDPALSNNSTIVDTASVSASTADPNAANNVATIAAKIANPHTLRFYLHGNDAPATAGGFTMNQTPAPSRTLSINLASSPRWYSEPVLNGTFRAGATFKVRMPGIVWLGVNTTFRLAVTNPDGSGEQVLGQATQSLGLGAQTIDIPVTTPATLNNKRLKLIISSAVGLNVNLHTGGSTYLEAASFVGTP